MIILNTPDNYIDVPVVDIVKILKNPKGESQEIFRNLSET